MSKAMTFHCASCHKRITIEAVEYLSGGVFVLIGECRRCEEKVKIDLGETMLQLCRDDIVRDIQRHIVIH
jgi:hypothetical protein